MQPGADGIEATPAERSASDGATARATSRSLGRLVFGTGSTIASTVYGTVVAMATVTAAYAAERDPWKVAATVSTTAVVLWIAHLYAHSLSERIHLARRLTRADFAPIARRELGIPLAAALPVAALVAGALGLLDEPSAVWLALGVGLVTLAGEGVRYARLERLGARSTIVAVSANLALGLLVVLLKIALAH
jgi:hypothetical protein